MHADPKPARRTGLSYADEEAVIADIESLRAGHAELGNWSLPMICWHLDRSLKARMTPGPFVPNTPEQDARKAVFDEVYATGKIPDGIVAPAPITPPRDASGDDIYELFNTLRRYAAYTEPVAPHRLFGHMSNDVAKRMNLIHCAHHLSYLVPA